MPESALALFTIVPIFIGVVFLIVFGAIFVGLYKAWRQRQHNKAQPSLTFPARVVSKRTHTSGGGRNTSSRTRYYVTFERPDRQRIELPVSGEEYGMLAEDDQGSVTHQGTWYQGFQRGPIGGPGPQA